MHCKPINILVPSSRRPAWGCTAEPGHAPAVQLPRDRKKVRYHWHLEITPRLTETAGFERETGFYINPVMLEDAASILREGTKAEKVH